MSWEGGKVFLVPFANNFSCSFFYLFNCAQVLISFFFGSTLFPPHTLSPPQPPPPLALPQVAVVAVVVVATRLCSFRWLGHAKVELQLEMTGEFDYRLHNYCHAVSVAKLWPLAFCHRTPLDMWQAESCRSSGPDCTLLQVLKVVRIANK